MYICIVIVPGALETPTDHQKFAFSPREKGKEQSENNRNEY